MKRTTSKRTYSVGELVNAAYKKASTMTCNRQVAGLVASKLLETWLARSNRPDLVERLEATSS